MIIDKVTDFGRYQKLGPAVWEKVGAFMSECTVATADGRYELVEGKVFALVQGYETKTLAEGKMEDHQKFADIQVVLAGEEYMYTQDKSVSEVKTPYNPEKDAAFYHYNAAGASMLKVPAGWFAVFYPGECHMPSVNEAKQTVKKIVFKIAGEYLV